MRRPTAGSTFAATVAVLVLAGCTGGSTSGPSDKETGPLSAFFEKMGASYTGEDGDRQQREYEEAIAACMGEQGFEYTPAEPMGVSAEMDDLPAWDSREYAEQYGYGATTSDEMFASSENEEWVDPNADYLAGMSESELTAYNEAMWGEMATEELDPEAELEYDWTKNGCSGKAQHEVYEQGDIWTDPELEPIFDEMNSEWEAIQDQPEVSKAMEAWSTCMAEAGHDFATPEEAAQSIHDEMNALWEAVAPSEEQIADLEAGGDDASVGQPDPAAKAELKKKELALATADFDCKESSDLLKVQSKASLEMEERLWEKYGDKLEAALATSGE